MDVSPVFVGTYVGVLVLSFHICVNGAGIKKGLELLTTSLRKLVFPPPSTLSKDDAQDIERIEEELQKMRLKIFKTINGCAIHVDFFMLLGLCWKIVQQSNDVTVCDACLGAFPYVFFSIFHSLSLIEVSGMWRVYQFLILSIHLTFVSLSPADARGKNFLVSLILVSSSMLDSRMSLPFCCLEGLINAYRNSDDWKNLQDEVAICGLTCMFAVVLEQLTRQLIEARLKFGDSACRLAGFRSALRGVCDGEILLDPNKTLVEDTTSLERIFNVQKTLSGSNFLNLFPAVEDRRSFLQFLSRPHCQPDQTPPACRVTLQGSLGTVSLDLFHVRVVNLKSSNDSEECDFLHLIAIKQDDEHPQAIPDARPDSGPSAHDTDLHRDSTVSSGPSEQEIPQTYNNLQEITLLLTSHSPMWDIGELHVKYRRRTFLDCGMPTLRNFTRPIDWERVLRKIEEAQCCTGSRDTVAFKKPFYLRLPGKGGRYLRSRKASMGRESEPEAEPVLLWLNLQDLEFGRCKSRSVELEGIQEGPEA